MQDRLFHLNDFRRKSGSEPIRSVLSQTEAGAVVLWHVLPGQKIAPHTHPLGQDTWLVLKGKALYISGIKSKGPAAQGFSGESPAGQSLSGEGLPDEGLSGPQPSPENTPYETVPYETTLIEPGMVLIAHPGQIHGAIQVGDESFEFLSVVAPGAAGFQLA